LKEEDDEGDGDFDGGFEEEGDVEGGVDERKWWPELDGALAGGGGRRRRRWFGWGVGHQWRRIKRRRRERREG